MKQVAYTNHIGRTSRDKHSGKNTAICTLADLAAAEKHNNHDYTPEEVAKMQSDINLDLKDYNSQYIVVDGKLTKIDGHINLEANVRKIYEDQFAAAVEEYNQRQVAAGHPGRQIQSYVDKISDSKQQEVAVEGLIQFGSLEDWEGKSMEEKQRVAPLLLKALEDTIEELQQEDAEFVLAGASIHLNEGSPHIHYVGVPVQHAENVKNGPKTRVKKTAVFTQETLGTGLQDNVRAKIEPQLMATFGWEFEQKRAGRNKDLTKNEIANAKLQEEIQRRKEESHSAEEQLGLIRGEIERTLEDLGDQIERYSDRRIEEVLGDPEGYGNILFLMSECDPDRLVELDQEGRELKEQLLRDATQRSLDPVREGLDKTLQAINQDKAKGLTWHERQEKWAEYQEVSEKFWAFRKEMQEYMNDAYRKKYDADRAYYDTLYFLKKNHGFLTTLIGLCVLLYQVNRSNRLQEELEEIRARQYALKLNTSSFSTFSRQYRNDLKAGKMPSDDIMDSMVSIMQQMDDECDRFMEQRRKMNISKSKEFSR